MARRATNVDIQIEYIPSEEVRFTSVGILVEHYPEPARRRFTSADIQIEYIPEEEVRFTSVEIQVEYYFDKILTSNIGTLSFTGQSATILLQQAGRTYGPALQMM